jgi:hypothetical protein
VSAVAINITDWKDVFGKFRHKRAATLDAIGCAWDPHLGFAMQAPAEGQVVPLAIVDAHPSALCLVVEVVVKNI